MIEKEMLRKNVNRLKNGNGYDELHSLMNLLDSDDGVITIAKPILGDIQKRLIEEIKEVLQEKDKDVEEYYNLLHALVILKVNIINDELCKCRENPMYYVAYVFATLDDGTLDRYNTLKESVIDCGKKIKATL